MISLAALLVVTTGGFCVVSWHHWARFSKRRHPLSVTAAMLPLCGCLACFSSLNDVLWQRVLTLSFCLVASLGTAATVFFTRRAEKRLEQLGEAAKPP